MKIYMIPGLGYDCRIFEKLTLDGYEVTHLNWIEPKKQEALEDYAFRLFPNVRKNEEIVLIGHSLGGVIAQEIAAKRNISKIILISSVQLSAEIPIFFKVVKPLGLHRLFTKELSIKTVKYWGDKHGMVSMAQKDLFRSMVSRHSNAYLQWALKALSGWTPPERSSLTKVFQIHGTDDRTFPLELIKGADVIIEGGTHIMVYSDAERVGEVLMEMLAMKK